MEEDNDVVEVIEERFEEPYNEVGELSTTAKNYEEDEECAIKKKIRKKTAMVWQDFKEVTLRDRKKKTECKNCRDKVAIVAGGTNSHLKRHLPTYVYRKPKGILEYFVGV